MRQCFVHVKHWCRPGDGGRRARYRSERLTIGGSYDTGTVVGITADGLRLRIASGEITVPFAQTPRWVMEESDESKR